MKEVFFKHRRALFAICSVAGAAFSAAPAHAQLEFTLTPTSQAYTQGQTATWSATFKNLGSTTLSFLGIGFTAIPTGLTIDDTSYFTNFDSTTLAAGSSATATLFSSSAALNMTTGTFDSNVTVTYRNAGDIVDSDASALFTSVVSIAVPEPGSMALGLLALPGLLLIRRRRA